MNISKPLRIGAFLMVTGGFTLVTLAHYPGQGYIYVIFSILLNALLFFGFRRGSIFFDTFLGMFLWIGFWLKFSVRMVFADGRFHESVGYFDYTATEYDRSLLVTSCGIAGLLAARLIRQRFLFRSLSELKFTALDGVRVVYARYRSAVWLGFAVLILGVTMTNTYFGIYQRGSVPRTILPSGLGGVYTWLLLFGMSSISAALLHFELQLRARVAYWVILLILMETFLSNVSMLSRGMILNSSALFLGVYLCAWKLDVSLRLRTIVIALATLILLFMLSIVVVNQLRIEHYELPPTDGVSEKIQGLWAKLAILAMDRWVGMEGVMAVSSYPGLGWELWSEVWDEKYSGHGTSLYDRMVSMSWYAGLNLSDRHFVSVPGILAFFYYPGSYGFLFLAMLALGLLGAAIEAAVYRWGGGNLVLCSLMAFVVAYRYVHFGYVPGRSYLLFGTLVLNVALIYLLGRVIAYSSGGGDGALRLDSTEHAGESRTSGS